METFDGQAVVEFTTFFFGNTSYLFTFVGNTFLMAILLVTMLMRSTLYSVTFVSFIVTKFFSFWAMVIGSAFNLDTFVTSIGTISILLEFTSACAIFTTSNQFA